MTERPVLLAYRALGLGDLLTAIPTLRGLRRVFPAYELVVATPAVLHPLLSLAGCVDDAVDAQELAPFPWDRSAPALAVNLHGSGPRSHELLSAMCPDRLVAYRCPVWPDGPDWCTEEHEVDRWARLVSTCLGVPVDTADLAVEAPHPLRPGVAVVHPGAADPARRWPAERFAAVARRLSTAGLEVVVTGGSAETDLVRAVCALAELPPSADLGGRLDIVELTCLVASATVVVCGDTGVGHLATATRTPSVLLFGTVPPSSWGPPPRSLHTVIHSPGVAVRDLEVSPGFVAELALHKSTFRRTVPVEGTERT